MCYLSFIRSFFRSFLIFPFLLSFLFSLLLHINLSVMYTDREDCRFINDEHVECRQTYRSATQSAYQHVDLEEKIMRNNYMCTYIFLFIHIYQCMCAWMHMDLLLLCFTSSPCVYRYPLYISLSLPPPEQKDEKTNNLQHEVRGHRGHVHVVNGSESRVCLKVK